MLDKKFFEFKEQPVVKQADLTAEYQLTKIAEDKYQWYNFSVNEAKLLNTKESLKTIATVRGGRCLAKDLTNKVISMPTMSSITVSASALQLAKRASTEDCEPWKVVAVNGVEYFINSSEIPDDVVQKTAANHTKHVYTINIKAHNFSEITKISNILEEKFDVVANTTQIPNGTEIVADIVSEATPEVVTSSIQKEVEGGKVYLPDQAYTCSNYACPCGCGMNHLNKPTVEQLPQQQEVMFMLVPTTSPIVSYASELETLKAYASAKYTDYKIYDANKNIVATASDNKENTKTFAEELTAFLDEQIALSKKAEEKNAFTDDAGNIVSADSATRVVTKKDDGTAEINPVSTESAEISVQADVDDLEHQRQNIDPNEKSSDETKAQGDDNVKRWKGMREDTQTGKFVVYITETEEHIFNTADEAIAYMTKK